jgi:GntR family transcriptional regulator
MWFVYSKYKYMYMKRTYKKTDIGYSLYAPKHIQIESVLRERVRSSFWPSEQLPSETALAEEFRVSRTTIRQAILPLVQEGVLERGKRKGTRMTPLSLDKQLEKYSGFLEDLLTRKDVRAKVMSFRIEPATQDVASSLSVESHTEIVAINRLIFIGDTPLAYLEIYFPHDIGTKIIRGDLERIPLIRAVQQQCKVKVGSVCETIEACPTDVKLGQTLKLAVGAPLLKITRVYFSEAGQAVEFVRSFYRGDRYQHLVRRSLSMLGLYSVGENE